MDKQNLYWLVAGGAKISNFDIVIDLDFKFPLLLLLTRIIMHFVHCERTINPDFETCMQLHIMEYTIGREYNNNIIIAV